MTGKRNVWQAMRNGALLKCPSCGTGKLFSGYGKTVESCSHCRTEIHHHRADDMPAYLVMFFWGKIVVTGFVTTAMFTDLPIWFHYVTWAPLMLIGAIALLPSMKGVVIAIQWANGMHGFGDSIAEDVEYDWP